MTSETQSSLPPAGDGSLSAEEAFDEFLRLVDEGREIDFDSFCGRYPDVADELRTLRLHWDRMEGVVDDLATGFPDDSADFARVVSGDGHDAPRVSNPATETTADSQERPPARTRPPGSETEGEEDPETSTSDAQAAAGILGRLSSSAPGDSRYAQRGEIARGGMGAIVRVWDKDLRRTLAMKVMLDKARDRKTRSDATGKAERQLGRFLEEAQITGQLDHPGIVPVHELGIDERGRLFFTMRLVRGRSLRSIFELVQDEREDWTVARALTVILRVCQALAYAHSKQVIHRDIKPANVMVGRFGETYVMDWGLAKVIGHDDLHDVRPRTEFDASATRVHSDRRDAAQRDPESPLVTMDGAVVGTPAYMSPEQARGQVENIGPATDVYAVGALLYHLLTGRMPYVNDDERVSPYTILNAVRDGPPRPIHHIDRRVPGDLVAICDKAMAREPADRYETMLDMAQDLQAFLEGRVVRAYEAGAFAQLRKWVGRNRATATVLLLMILSLAAGLLFVLAQNERLARTIFQVRTQEELTRTARMAEAERVVELNEALGELAVKERQALSLATEAERRSYVHSMAAVEAALRDHSLDAARRGLDASPEALRGWEWEHLALAVEPSLAHDVEHSARVTTVAFDPTGTQLASGSWDGTVRLRELEAGADPSAIDLGDDGVTAIAFHPANGTLAVGSYAGALTLWNAETSTLLEGGDDPRTADWSLFPDTVAGLAFGPDGHLLYAVTDDHLWEIDLVLRERHAFPRRHSRPITSLAVSSDGTLVVTGAEDSSAMLWDALLREPITELFNDAVATCVAVDPEGARVATGGEDGTVRLFDVADGGLLHVFEGHRGAVRAVVFDADGRMLLSASDDDTLRLWDTHNRRPVAALMGHTDDLTTAAISSDGRHLASGSLDGSVRLWDAAWSDGTTALRDHTEAVRSLAPSSDGGRLVTCGWGARVLLWDTTRPVPRAARDLVRSGPAAVAMSDDGRWVAAGFAGPSGHDSYPIQLWDASHPDDLRDERRLSGHAQRINDVAFAPGGDRLASVSDDGTVQLWRTSDGARVRTLQGHSGWVRAVAFHPHEPWIASGSYDETVRIWHADDGFEIRTLDDHRGPVHDVAFSPDGTLLASACKDGQVRIYACDGWELRHVLAAHGDDALAVAFHPDGRRLVSSGRDGMLRIWDAEHGELLLTLRTGGIASEAVAFSPDGARLYAALGPDVRVYETRPPTTTFATRRRRADVAVRAEALLDELLDRLVSPAIAVAWLEQDRAMDDAVRDEALRMARNFGDAAWRLTETARGLVLDGRAGSAAWADALRMARAAARSEPEDPSVLNVLGIAQLRCGEARDALSTLEEALDLNTAIGAYPTSWDLLPIALAHHALGSDNIAAAYLQEAVFLRQQSGAPMSDGFLSLELEARRAIEPDAR